MPANVKVFPDTLSAVPTAELIDVYEAGPARLAEVLDGLTEQELQARPIPDKWSSLEIAMHVLDSELVGVGRLRTALAAPGAPFRMYDQDVWTERLGHQSTSREDLEANLRALTAVRAATGRLFRGLEAASWSRSGWHAELGPVTVRQILELYADHIERHLTQIAERREILGRPIEFTPLLPRPLY